MSKAQEFLRLNEAMAVRALLDQVLEVERRWEDAAERQRALQELFQKLELASTHRSPLLQRLALLRQRVPEDPSYHQFMSVFVPIEREHGRMVTDADILIDQVDHVHAPARYMPAVLILDNIRSAFNVGSLLRMADCIGFEKVYLCGYTARPDQDKVAKAALGAQSKVAWEWQAHTLACVQALKQTGTPVFALETAQGATALEAMQFPPQRLGILCGNERYGIEASVLRECQGYIEIPCWGYKNSLNVSVSVGMLAFELRRQWLQSAFLVE